MESEHPLTKYWPFFGLRIRTPTIELRVPTDDDLPALIEVQEAGIHDPLYMPFGVAWTDAPEDERTLNSVQHNWKARADLRADDWKLHFGVWRDGQVLGVQSLHAQQYPVLKKIGTGSWLGKQFQGEGVGKEMRTGVLHFAFKSLGCQLAETEAFDDNPQSRGVTEGLGYTSNGFSVHERRGESARIERYVMTREMWEANPIHQREDIVVEGLEPCLPLLGAR